jgi:excinuclease ABC subunit C
MINQLENIPSKPGVYIFRDTDGNALYVGKAVNLKNRVGSYFRKDIGLGPKTSLMVSKIKRIEQIVVESELEALLLEADLIKRLKPTYNVRLADDKAYKYIKISKGKRQKAAADYPKVSTSRKIDKENYYFGPFPEGQTVNYVLKSLRRIFPFRDCREAKFNRYRKLGRPCLYGDLGLCSAPCVGRITTLEYKKIITQLRRFLKGESKKIICELEKEMAKNAKAKNFEQAAGIRDRLKAYNYIRQKFRSPQDYLKNPNLLEDQRQKELNDLQKRLGLRSTPGRIEAYDISNIGGQYATGSMVVFVDGEPSKKDYRRFKIKTVKGISDVDMIKEVLRRRFAQTKSVLNTLILVDGGKPQVSATNDVLEGLSIEVVGLAKREEMVVTRGLQEIRLPKDSPSLDLLRRIRDEAHRFALSYHKKLRSGSMVL